MLHSTEFLAFQVAINLLYPLKGLYIIWINISPDCFKGSIILFFLALFNTKKAMQDM